MTIYSNIRIIFKILIGPNTNTNMIIRKFLFEYSNNLNIRPNTVLGVLGEEWNTLIGQDSWR